MKKIIAFIFLLVFVLNASSIFASECKVTILHFNDLHGFLNMPKKGLGGAVRIANLVAKIDQQNLKEGRHTLLLNGGDLLYGTPISELYKGKAEFEFLEIAGNEAMVIGNHEFDFGYDNLKKLIKKASFPLLSANVIDTKSKRLVGKATYVFPLGPGCRVGLMGLTHQETPEMTDAKNVTDLKFDDPIIAAGYYIDDFLEQADARIALTHLGVPKDIELVKKVKGFDLVVGGHDHVFPKDYCQDVGKVPVCQTPSRGKYLGRIDLTIRDGRVTIDSKELIPVGKKAGKSKDVKEMLKRYPLAAAGK